MPKQKKTKSIRKFTVSYSPRIARGLFYLSYVFVIIGLFLFIISGFDEEGARIFVFLFSLSALVWLFVLALFLWRLEVDKESLRFRTFFGKTKEIQVSELDKIVLTDQKSLVLYANGKKLGTLNRDFQHLDNFHSYCEARGLVLQSKTGKPLTKSGLYLGAMKVFFGAGIGIGIFVGFILLMVGVVNNNLMVGLVSAGSVFIFFLAMFIIIGSIVVLPGIFRIMAQELFFRMTFREEMQKRSITKIEHISEEWFIEVAHQRILVFRRGFIAKVEQIRGTNHSSGGFIPRILVMIAWREDGRRMKIVGEGRSIEKLNRWLEEGFEDKSA